MNTFSKWVVGGGAVAAFILVLTVSIIVGKYALREAEEEKVFSDTIRHTCYIDIHHAVLNKINVIVDKDTGKELWKGVPDSARISTRFRHDHCDPARMEVSHYPDIVVGTPKE